MQLNYQLLSYDCSYKLIKLPVAAVDGITAPLGSKFVIIQTVVSEQIYTEGILYTFRDAKSFRLEIRVLFYKNLF